MKKILIIIIFTVSILLLLFVGFILIYKTPQNYELSKMKRGSTKSEVELDGFLLSGFEFFVYTDSLQMTDNKIIFPEKPLWVEDSDIVEELFNKNAYIVHSESKESNDVKRVLKIKFRGIRYDNGSFGHLGKYNSMIEIKYVLDYSNKFDFKLNK